MITKKEKRENDGYNLHSIRKAAADKILAKGASSYVNRIQTFAITKGIRYKGINKPEEFWKYLLSLKDNSITRVLYSGHASGSELMLALTHDTVCEAAAFPKDTIKNSEISKWSSLRKKFSRSSIRVSKFYGCFTDTFAKKWHNEFGVSAAGAKNKIDFGVVDRASNIVNVMERIERTSTSVGTPDWTEYK